MFVLITLALGVIFLSGVLSMVEASLFSYSIRRARLAAARGGWLAKQVLETREKPLRLIAALVVLSSSVTIGGSITIGSLASKQFSSEGIGLFSAILTFVSIIISEIIPKNIGERWSAFIFPVAALPLQWVAWLLSPLVWFFALVAKPFTLGASPFTTSEEEIALLTRVGAKEGTIEADEAEMIQRVFRLNDIIAGDMMTPRHLVIFIDGNKTVGEVAEFIKDLKHSRIPVFEREEDNIIGIVHQRDLLRALINSENERKISDYAREAMIVPTSRRADDLIRDFQGKRNQLAIVVNEDGKVVGIVGLEDVLEELVGEII